MTSNPSPFRTLKFIGSMVLAMAGPALSRWSPRPPLPRAKMPRRYELGNGIALWRLPTGFVRIREWHRALPETLADVDDRLRFAVMMSNRDITGWLDCTAWLIEHPEKLILIDTGESASFGTPAYFSGVPKTLARTYTRIIDGTCEAGFDLNAALAACGVQKSQIDQCVLTHTHSDHVGNLDILSKRTQIIVSPGEFSPSSRSGRLVAKLPRDGRVRQSQFGQLHEFYGPTMPLTTNGDIFLIPTPGHTVGHQSLVIDLGDKELVIAGDVAFDDRQVENGTVPGIIEDRPALLQTYERFRLSTKRKTTLHLFTHDSLNGEKLDRFASHDTAKVENSMRGPEGTPPCEP